MTGGEPAPGALLDNLVGFGRLLRGAGLDVPPARITALAEALRFVDLSRRDEFRDAARALLVSRREHLAPFDRLFDAFWSARRRRWAGGPEPFRPPRAERKVVALAGAAADGGAAGGAEDAEPALLAWSPGEVLRHRDFAELTAEELEEVERLISELELELPPRRTRRRRPARRGAHLDLRRTLRRSLRHGGETLTLARKRRKEKPRPLVALCDVSGSMELYSRILLKFLYVAGRSRPGFEAFLFGTRLSRVTRQLAVRDVDRAVADSLAAAPDRGGGTRIGAAIKSFNWTWSRRLLGRGAVVLVISDGWDRGEPELLGREVARLARSSARLVWLSPLVGAPGYRPLTRGLVAALPHVDDFLPVRNLASLEALTRRLPGMRPRRA